VEELDVVWVDTHLLLVGSFTESLSGSLCCGGILVDNDRHGLIRFGVMEVEALFSRLARVLRPGGVLEIQCGGEGNIDRVRDPRGRPVAYA
jgi:hypothetical protein